MPGGSHVKIFEQSPFQFLSERYKFGSYGGKKNYKFICYVFPGVVTLYLESAFKLDRQVRRGCFIPYACDGAKMSPIRNCVL